LAIASVLWLSSCGDSPDTKTRHAGDSTSRAPLRAAGIVEVLNGTGRKGAANVVAERLRKLGFDVVKVGNAPERNYSRTLVAERRAAPAEAAAIARAIGVRSVFPYHNENLLVDATVFVGRDFEEIQPP
jgi:LytR cell envelope-related transcriptional attenuator